MGAALLCGAFAQRPEFEVASVKQDLSGLLDLTVPHRSGNIVTMHHTSVYRLIQYAYQLTGGHQLAGFPSIPDSWSYLDIEARADAAATDDEIRLMFQSLLEERLKLKVHRETRIEQTYTTPAKAGSKLRSAREGPMEVSTEGRTIAATPEHCVTTLWNEGNNMLCHGATMDSIVTELSRVLQAPVANHTGLIGTYDVNLVYLPDSRKLEENAPPTPSLQDAVQEQLGLKLEKERGPVECLVIDHLEQPSQN